MKNWSHLFSHHKKWKFFSYSKTENDTFNEVLHLEKYIFITTINIHNVTTKEKPSVAILKMTYF
jgi:hypothetical protein